MELLVATQNSGKKREFAKILEKTSIELLFLDEVDLKGFDFPEESGKTFRENALIKAQSLANFLKINTIADDSGLCVDILDGFPGVKSARWMPGSDLDRINGLLDKLNGVVDRSAHFVSSICLYSISSQQPHFFEGICNGKIANTPAGSNGFGYDPIFIPNGQTQTFAELESEYKNRHSHRALALQKLQRFIESTDEAEI